MSKGTDLTAIIREHITKTTGGRIMTFRTNAGSFWGGEFNSRHTIKGVPYTVLKNANRVEGLPEGFADLLVIIPTVITPDMVGHTVACAGFVEVKAPGDVVKKHQEEFLALMRSAGARAGIARTSEDATQILGV